MPTRSSVIVAPLVPPALQTDPGLAVNVTGKPDDAVAETVIGDCDRDCDEMFANVIVCEAFVTEKLRFTFAAAFHPALPAWLALTVQVPVFSSVIDEPFVPPAVHTVAVVVVNVTGRPDDAVAVMVTGDCTSVFDVWLANVIVCEPFVTLKLWFTG